MATCPPSTTIPNGCICFFFLVRGNGISVIPRQVWSYRGRVVLCLSCWNVIWSHTQQGYKVNPLWIQNQMLIPWWRSTTLHPPSTPPTLPLPTQTKKYKRKLPLRPTSTQWPRTETIAQSIVEYISVATSYCHIKPPRTVCHKIINVNVPNVDMVSYMTTVKCEMGFH